MVGVPWEMSFQDGYVLREKGGNAYGYNSYIALVPELKLGMIVYEGICYSHLSYTVLLKRMIMWPDVLCY